ncbi:hypothetical protein GGH94_000201 [Coemansia aciculifera]|uniref:Uncharacterized protein n=1 Tax=Coemansia aciculifera TaxID=417176 RepID=A0A9W8M853_9FUNG|nr:hypothetical protein GGH94_000201 [Coemansia aciculifera]KAJ2873722.1 hypothetical protein GGH93_002985 [Coemansia aciculifera]
MRFFATAVIATAAMLGSTEVLAASSAAHPSTAAKAPMSSSTSVKVSHAQGAAANFALQGPVGALAIAISGLAYL